jgi:hypothetical protein
MCTIIEYFELIEPTYSQGVGGYRLYTDDFDKILHFRNAQVEYKNLQKQEESEEDPKLSSFSETIYKITSTGNSQKIEFFECAYDCDSYNDEIKFEPCTYNNPINDYEQLKDMIYNDINDQIVSIGEFTMV